MRFGAATVVLALNFSLPLVAVGAVFVAVWIFQSGFQPLIDAISLNALSDRRDYARLRMLTSLAVAIVSIVVGFIYDQTGYGIVYWLYPLLLMGLVFAAWRVPDVGRADLHAISRARREAPTSQQPTRPNPRSRNRAPISAARVAAWPARRGVSARSGSRSRWRRASSSSSVRCSSSSSG